MFLDSTRSSLTESKNLWSLNLSKACQYFQISQLQSNSFQDVRTAYRNKMRTYSQNRRKRIKLNAVYQFLCMRLFKTTQPEEEIINLIIMGETDKVASKISKKKSLLNYRTVGDNYPLVYHAVRSGNYDIVELFLKNGCSLDFSQHRSTPMHCAAYYGHYTLIPLLLKYGVSTSIKNECGNLPIDEACTSEIERLLKNANEDNIYKLQSTLNSQKLLTATINIKENGVTVIRKLLLARILRNYNNHVDAFHGTSFSALQSIAKYGLRPSGSSVGETNITPVPGHINRGVTINGISNWSDAIFVSPSIYYAGHPIYAPVMINNETQRWLPIVQTKIKNGTYTSHDHTFVTTKYQLLQNEPKSLQYRVSVKKTEDNSFLIMRNQKAENVQVVALILIKQGYLNDHEDYHKTTQLILNSPEQKQFRKYL